MNTEKPSMSSSSTHLVRNGTSRVSPGAREIFLLALVFLLVIGGICFGLFSIMRSSVVKAANIYATATALTIHDKQSHYPDIAGQYIGTSLAKGSHEKVTITFLLVENKKNGSLNGLVISSTTGPIWGIVGTDGTVKFTTYVIDYTGSIQQDGSLIGIYKTYKTSTEEEGSWVVTPLSSLKK